MEINSAAEDRRSTCAIPCYRHLDSELLACPVSRSQPNRSFISTAGALLALSLSLSCHSKPTGQAQKARSSGESTDSQTADLIARVKDVSASRLEKGLPTVRFEDWLRENAGPDWTRLGALIEQMNCILRVLTSSAAWTFAVTLRMVDTLDSQSEPPRMRTRFFCSGIAEQRTFSIGGSVWSILANYRDCSITRA